MSFLATSLRALYQALPKPPPFLLVHHHLLTAPPLLASQRQRTYDDLPAVTCTTQIHRSTRFAWNKVPLVDTRW
jgi:hypothetical protein